MLTLAIAGEPVPKGRPRVTSHGTYTPKRTRTAEQRIGWAMLQKYAGLQVDATSRFRVRLLFWTESTDGDVDNLAKTVLDGLQGVVWANDNQVDELLVERASRRGLKGTDIEIQRIVSPVVRGNYYGRSEADRYDARGARLDEE